MIGFVRTTCILALALPATCGFQFMSKWKRPVKIDVEGEAKIKERFGDKKLVVITGTSSGLGRKAAQALLRSGEYHVIGAVRDIDKMETVAKRDGFDMDSFTPMHCELNSFESVRQFCRDLEEFKLTKPIDRLICNAGVYQPSLPYAKWSKDGHEQTMQINFLSHFLMVSELMDDMTRSGDPRIIMVGSNDNAVGGGGVYPLADLQSLEGFEDGFKNPVCMADGYSFNGAKAYKDSKLCLMMMSNYLHAKYRKSTGIAFSSMYPGCIAESALFREKGEWFRENFPIFMKSITGGFVSEDEAGQRLFQVAHDPRCSKSGVSWSWNGGQHEGGDGWDSIYENDQSDKVNDIELGLKLFQYSTEITGAEWPKAKQVTSPCPTLKVIGAVTKGMVAKQELERMAEYRPGMDNPIAPPKVSRAKKAAAVTNKVVGKVMKHTVGRVGRFVGRRVLGRLPDTAIEGSYEEGMTQVSPDMKTDEELMEDVFATSVSKDGQQETKGAISDQVFREQQTKVDEDSQRPLETA